MPCARLCPPWTLALLLPIASLASALTVTGWVGQPVTLPCRYTVRKESDIYPICWGSGSCPSSKCGDPILTTEERKITWKKSNRYELRGQLHQGDVSLTILDASERDSGTYCCRVEVPGWFNDLKHDIVLKMMKAPTTTPRTTTTTTTTAPTTGPTTAPMTDPTNAPTMAPTITPTITPTTAAAPTTAPATLAVPSTDSPSVPTATLTTDPTTAQGITLLPALKNTPTASPTIASSSRRDTPTVVLSTTTSTPRTALANTPAAPTTFSTTAALMARTRTTPTITDRTPSGVTSLPRIPSATHTARSMTATRLLPPAETTGRLLTVDMEAPPRAKDRDSSMAGAEDIILADTTQSKTGSSSPGNKMKRKGESLSTSALIAVVCGSVAFCIIMLLLGLTVKGKILKSCHVDKNHRFGPDGSPTELLNRAPQDADEAQTLFTLEHPNAAGVYHAV